MNTFFAIGGEKVERSSWPDATCHGAWNRGRRRNHERAFRKRPGRVHGVLVLVLLLVIWVGWIARAATPDNPGGPRGIARIQVDGFRYQGSTVFSAAQLDAAVTNSVPVGRLLGDGELEAARRAVTDLYVRHGYWNSGAIIPYQVVTNRWIKIEIIEGDLTEVHVHTAGGLSTNWIARRFRSATRTPLQLQDLASAVQRLRSNPNIKTVTAELNPLVTNGVVRPGGAVLDARVEQASPWRASVQVDNYRPPSVGAEQLWVTASHQNLTGHGDSLDLTYGILQRSRSGGVEFSGADNVGINYTLPLNPHDTQISASYDRRDYAVIEEPFQDLDIESQYWSAGLHVRQPLFRRNGRQWVVGLGLERRHSEGSLLGEPFSFSPGSVRGKTDETVVRFFTEWSDSHPGGYFLARLLTSVGLDLFGARSGRLEPDGAFVSLLGQIHYTRELWEGTSGTAGTSGELVVRGAFQWTPESLFAMEQLSLGGANTVRGYRENLLVRDTGLLASVELRVGLIERPGFVLHAGPFVDFGAGWNVDFPTEDPVSITSVGVGVESTFLKRGRVRLDWGHPFNDTGSDTGDAQDLGLHFRFSWLAL